MNVLDLFLTLCLVGGAIGGLRRGLVRGLVGLAGLIVGVVAASRLYRPLSAYLETQYGAIGRLASSITLHLPLAATVGSAPASQGTALTDALQALDLPAFITRYLVSWTTQTGLPAGATVGQTLSLVLASAIMGAACFLGIFFVVQILAALLAGVFRGVLAVTPLGFVDHLVGGLLGFCWAGVILTVLVGGLGLLSSVPTFAFVRSALDGALLVPTFLSLFEFFLPRIPQLLG